MKINISETKNQTTVHVHNRLCYVFFENHATWGYSWYDK